MVGFNIIYGLMLVLIFQSIKAQNTCKCIDGLNGRDGRDGLPGRDGKSCDLTKAGSDGAGAQGSRGPSGANGINGSPGAAGATGPQGDRGPEGPRGDRGSPGRDGTGSGSVDKTEIERMVQDILKARGGSPLAPAGTTGVATSGSVTPGALKRVSICSSLSKFVCGECQCRDKNYADEFFSRGHYCDCQNVKAERDCKKHRQIGKEHDGIYLINPGDVHPFPVYCDMSTENGGWVVVQRRIDDMVDFKRDWFSYKNGFGNLQHEFWLGNENMFLVQLYDDRRGTELMINMKEKDGETYTEKYGVFELGDESTKYKLHVAGYSGNAGDWLKYNNNKKFCTYDSDNDEYGGNSALNYGAYWHGAGSSYPYHANTPFAFVSKENKGHNQRQVKAFHATIKSTTKYITHIEMKIRRK